MKWIQVMWGRNLIGVLTLTFCAQGYAHEASASHPSALTEQGLRHLHGEGVPRDPDLAVVYLCAAALDGDGAAAYELGWLYFQGRGVERDDALAAAWLREATRLGQAPTAQVAQRVADLGQKPLACVNSQGMLLSAAGPQRARLVLDVHRMAPEFALDPKLVVEVIRAESNFNPRARSQKGALGLMQLIPATAERFGVSDPYEPTQNIRGGMAYLSWLLDRFDGDLALALAGYNAGEASVERYRGIPPYAETQAYVKRILGRYLNNASKRFDHKSARDWHALSAAHTKPKTESLRNERLARATTP